MFMVIILMASVMAGCLDGGDNGDEEMPKLTQTGSSTVLPLGIAWAEEYDGADISVSGGGSSHGINSLLNKEADLGDASRLMKGSDYEKMDSPASDVNADGSATAPCNGVMPIKWVVAFDILTVVVNNDNNWSSELNYTQLYKIFTDDDPAEYWDEVAGFGNGTNGTTWAPHEKIEIYAPDEASGTYDYFFEGIIPRWGKDDQQANTRLDAGDEVYHPSADDNVILNAINSQKYAIGYFGFSYYIENAAQIQPVSIANDYEDAGNSAVMPSMETVAEYPMARPLHIYTDENSDKKDAVDDYIRYILSDEGQSIVPEVGYVKLELVDVDLLQEQRARL
jgi:phosphate transport system substrate-binding protein